jgi:hypothetical protein
MAAVFFGSITNNYIHDTGWWYGHPAAIHLSGPSGSLIVTHNTICRPRIGALPIGAEAVRSVAASSATT